MPTPPTPEQGGTKRPPNLYLDMSGEAFEFQTSAKTGDGVFRFRWTLAGGKKGPPEHVHEEEAETFTVITGTLRIWIDRTPRDLGPGQTITVQRGVRHRFLNPTKEPVVVDVSLDGPRQEDVLVPMALYFDGRRTLKIRDFFVAMVHGNDVRATRAPGALGNLLLRMIGGVGRLFGAKPLPRAPGW